MQKVVESIDGPGHVCDDAVRWWCEGCESTGRESNSELVARRAEVDDLSGHGGTIGYMQMTMRNYDACVDRTNRDGMEDYDVQVMVTL